MFCSRLLYILEASKVTLYLALGFAGSVSGVSRIGPSGGFHSVARGVRGPDNQKKPEYAHECLD